MSSSDASVFARYIPRVVLRSLATNGLPPCPGAEVLGGAVLLADISGYTTLTERLTSRSEAGVEELCRLLNSHFDTLINLIEQYGGDVLKFAGDAIVAFWPETPGDVRAAVESASHCAFAMQDHFAVTADESIGLRIGISAGNVVLMHLRADEEQREIVVAGAAVVEIAAIEAAIRPGEVILTNRAWARIREFATGAVLQNGAIRLERPSNVKIPSTDGGTRAIEVGAGELLRAYIPANIVPRLVAGQSDWLAELRRVTVLFVKLPGLSQTISPQVAQDLLSSIQVALVRYEGCINNISTDDRGISVLATFGLPPRAHEDDPVRAIEAALAVEEALQAQGFLGAVGVTTGSAFCGLLGNELRLQYVILGDVVNRASRLMTASSTGTLCDVATRKAAQGYFGFEAYPAIRVKGKTEPIEIYRPFRARRARRDVDTPLLVGRAHEQLILQEALTALRDDKRGGLILVEGEAGIGKSRLVHYVDELARDMGIRVIRAAAEAIDASTPYHAWRSAFAQLLGLESLGSDPEARRRATSEYFSHEDGRIAPFGPLLSPLFGFDAVENEVTLQMDPETRARNTQALLLDILERLASPPLLLLLEDGHWFDSASWQLARQVVQNFPNLLVLVTLRPGGQSSRNDGASIARPETLHIRLKPLSRSECARLIATRAGTGDVPQRVVDFVCSRAEGNPFYIEQILLALKDAEVLRPNAAEAFGRAEVQLQAVSLPESLQGVIVSRIDGLPPEPQLCLKVASVIGRYVPVSALRAIYPIESDAAHLDEYLAYLVSRNLLEPAGEGHEATYRFQHAVTQEATYALLPVGQRQRLHRAAAEWYEREYVSDPAPVYPILVHHWRGASVREALDRYLDLAGDQALASGAYREAIDFFMEGQAHTSEPVEEVTPGNGLLRWAMRERKIGEAYYGLGRLSDSHRHLRDAIRILDRPLPRSRTALAVRILGESTNQLGHRMRVPRRKRQVRSLARSVEACLSYERLAELGFFLGQDLEIVYDVLRHLNLAEAAGAQAQAARSYAHMGALLDLVPVRSLARSYERRALDAADFVDQLPVRALVCEAIGLSSVGRGDWEKASTFLARGAEHFRQLGNRRKWEECLSMSLTPALLHRTDYEYFDRVADELRHSASKSGDPQSQSWVLYDQARLASMRGRFLEAQSLVESAISLLPASVDPSDEIRFHGLRATVSLRLGLPEEAREAIRHGMAGVRRARSLAYYLYEGYAELADACLTVAAAAGDRHPSDRADLRHDASIACDALRRHARLFPIAEPSAAWVVGLVEWGRGHRSRAMRAWRRSLAAACRLEMPYSEGLAHLALGACSDPTGGARVSHLAQAAVLFEQTKAEFLGRCVRAAFEGRFRLPIGADYAQFVDAEASGPPWAVGDVAAGPNGPA